MSEYHMLDVFDEGYDAGYAEGRAVFEGEPL